jgi:hypothetical protein
MDRFAFSLIWSHLQGGRVPRARLEPIIAAECQRIQDEGVDLVPDLVYRFLEELRPDGVGGRRGPGRKRTRR